MLSRQAEDSLGDMCQKIYAADVDAVTQTLALINPGAVTKAAELLLSTGRRVADIAAQCGFQDASYFTRTFREHRGCSPAEYRRNRGLAAPETSPHPLPPDQHH